ncbi:PAAR domain-containing protein [uncultured Desulfobulbus sp.]|uniref:PAAR domain-containing protein n=1 Tax=uncultured Desulfobulbus sp. TaxID=239745 RepID=UPI0029C7E531|nr:PAAR domain-containing protein [uncultured Desulfobulbus sp.]
MAFPSARIGDNHTCPMVDPGPKPHVGGPILPPCHPVTTAGSLPMSRVTDKATCLGPPDFIVTGAGSVLVGGKPASRTTDKTMHGGVITGGLGSVVIGGPTVGATLGDPLAGRDSCASAAGGRTSGKTQQTYGNCGVESTRQIINRSGKNIDEDSLLNTAIEKGWAEDSTKAAQRGGTSPADRLKILKSQGVDSTLEPQGMQSIQQGVAEGKGVITSHDAGKLWDDPRYNGGGHAVQVTGVEYDADGKAKTVFINDTGTGKCMNPVKADQFNKSLRPGRGVNVTTNPL